MFSLLKSVSVTAGMTGLSRIAGLARDIVFANVLGDRAVADVFFVAFRLPNMFRRWSAEGAFSAAFVPVFNQFRGQYTHMQTQHLLALVLGRFGLALLLLCALCVLGAEWLVSLIAPNFRNHPLQFAETVALARLTFPYLFCVSLVALVAAVLNSCGRFGLPAAAPIVLNLCLIAGALGALQAFAEMPYALGAGVLIAGVLQVLMLLPALHRAGFLVRPRLRAPDGEAASGCRRVLQLLGPGILGQSAGQINLLVGTALASFLVTGSIAWLNYSERLLQFPIGVFGVALVTVILPELARRRDTPLFADTLDWALRWVLLICLPATLGLAVLAFPLIATIYFHGHFSERGVAMTAAALAAYAFGLLPIVWVKVLSAGLFADQNTRTPMRIAFIAVAVNVAVSLALFVPLKHIGLALALGVAGWVNAGLLLAALYRRRLFRLKPGWGPLLARTIAAGLIMAVGLGAVQPAPERWLIMPVIERCGHLMWLIAGGAAVYFAALRLFGLSLRALMRRPAE